MLFLYSYGPFWYYSNRLYWLHENQKAFVSDINGKNLAEVDGLGLNGLSSIGIIDPSLQLYPGKKHARKFRNFLLSILSTIKFPMIIKSCSFS